MLKPVMPSTHEQPNPDMPWYRGKIVDGVPEVSHGWYIGFAPADRPQVAFAVLVEYGVSGGASAGAVARGVLLSCMEHGYLKPDAPRDPAHAAARRPAADGDAARAD
jgi:hypothetical protein